MELNMLERVRKILSNISRGSSHGQKSPHKLIFLLTLAKLCEKSNIANRFTFTDVEKVFEKMWKKHVSWIPYSSSLLELPFNYLQSDNLWRLVPKAGCTEEIQTFPRLTRNRIIRTIEYGYLDTAIFNLLCETSTRDVFISEIIRELEPEISLSTQNTFVNVNNYTINPFVSYINSLNSLDGNSDGALAEKQAQEAQFCQIHISHPLVDEIYSILTTQGLNKHIILTGHAGDGKSTIALELYKRIKQLPADLPLDAGLQAKKELNYGGIPITIVKDLSEWSREEQMQLWKEIKSNQRRFLLVSNTGSLLSLILNNCDSNQKMLWEDRVLEAMDSSRGKNLVIENIIFSVYNLALRNNIDIAKKLWQKMIHAPGWEKCQQCSFAKGCPILRNVSLIQQYDSVILERLSLLLERISAYGSRLTMRQISAHFSYMLCSGYNCSQIMEQAVAGARFHDNAGDYFFFNHFFGDNANAADYRAEQLKSVKVIKAQNFESRFASSVERYFWLEGQKGSITLNIPELEKYYNKVSREASFEIDPESNNSDGTMARRQIRRMFYFLHTPSESTRANFEKFLGAFLNSEMLLQYNNWHQQGELAFEKRTKLLNQLFQVLQEHFCGVRIPDGSKSNGKSLYITLARRQHNIRQSAQVVLGKINFTENFSIKFESNVVILQGKAICKGIDLELTLPFLDYIAHRKNGGISSVLQSSYIDRLEKFKTDVLKRCALPNDDGLVLLKQNNTYELYQQRLRMEGDKLEVSND